MGTKRVRLFKEAEENVGMKRLLFSILTLTWIAFVAIGCAHYPINQPLKQVDPQSGYQAEGTRERLETLRIYYCILLSQGEGHGPPHYPTGFLKSFGRQRWSSTEERGDWSMRSMGYRVYQEEVSRQVIMAFLEIAFLRILKASF